MVKSIVNLETDFNIVCMKVYAVYLALDMESSFNQKMTKRSVIFHYSVSWQQYHIIYHLFPWIRTGLQIHMDMENGHINTKCTKQLQYMVHKLFDIIK